MVKKANEGFLDGKKKKPVDGDITHKSEGLQLIKGHTTCITEENMQRRPAIKYFTLENGHLRGKM